MGPSLRPRFAGASGTNPMFQRNGGPHNGGPRNGVVSPGPNSSPPFEIFEWHEHVHSCIRFFLDHSQYDFAVQSLATFINIQLPCQRVQNPVFSYSSSTARASTHASTSRAGAGGSMMQPHSPPSTPSLLPYIRRLVATGFDTPEIMNGFFGEDWQAGVGPLHQTERRNYLFAAKSGSWVDVKTQYDMPDGQLVPFLKPLHNVSEREIIDAEAQWSEWLAMQDWMVGPRSPDVTQESSTVIIKTEEA